MQGPGILQLAKDGICVNRQAARQTDRRRLSDRRRLTDRKQETKRERDTERASKLAVCLRGVYILPNFYLPTSLLSLTPLTLCRCSMKTYTLSQHDGDGSFRFEVLAPSSPCESFLPSATKLAIYY